MKRFSEYLNEDFDPAIFNADGNMSIDDSSVVDAINANLEASTACSFRTPYIALEEIRKVLAYYKIFLPKSTFLDQNHGNDVFEISQFGEKTGMNDKGEVVTANDSPLFVYFEWSMNEKGMYDIFASIVNQEDLDEILSDFEAEIEDDETDLREEHSMASKTKMLYRIVNARRAEDHTKETQSLKAEETMPNLKKEMASKMAKNKVTLAKRMQTENEINEVSREWLEKKASRGFDLHHAYIWKDKYKKADKKIEQIKKIGEYMKKKGMTKAQAPSKKEPDELQKRYDELQYKGD